MYSYFYSVYWGYTRCVISWGTSPKDQYRYPNLSPTLRDRPPAKPLAGSWASCKRPVRQQRWRTGSQGRELSGHSRLPHTRSDGKLRRNKARWGSRLLCWTAIDRGVQEVSTTVCRKLAGEISVTQRVVPRDSVGGSDSWNWITWRGKTGVFCLFLHHVCLCQCAAAAWLQTLPSGYPPVSAAWFSTAPLGGARLVVFSSRVRYTLGNTIGSFFSLFTRASLKPFIAGRTVLPSNTAAPVDIWLRTAGPCWQATDAIDS